MKRFKRWLLLALLGTTGCEATLETGYKPHYLNASESERRSYYAPEFTPESHPSKDQSAPDLSMQR